VRDKEANEGVSINPTSDPIVVDECNELPPSNDIVVIDMEIHIYVSIRWHTTLWTCQSSIGH
jgi:hypothetical protein